MQGHFAEPKPIPTKPRFPVRANYKGFAPKNTVSATKLFEQSFKRKWQ